MLKFIEVLKNEPDKAYDYICNNYYNMSKEELKDITKELLYAIYDNKNKIINHDEILDGVAEELLDFYEE